jgi:aerobic carbon-monoxide dehydrogenase medium subunit
MAVPGIEAYHRPRDVDTAWQLLREGGAAVRLLAGGSDLIVSCPAGVTTLVDLQAAGLGGIGAAGDGGLVIGAMATFTDLLEHPAVAGYAGGVIGELLNGFGSLLHRNSGTIGGHLARARMSDLVPTLLALDARVEVQTDTRDELALEDYLAGTLGPHVLTAVHLPAPAGRVAGFARISRTTFDHSLVTGCVALRVADGGADQAGGGDGRAAGGDGRAAGGDEADTGSTATAVVDARVAVGEAGTLGRRLPAAEAALVGHPLDDDAVAAAVDATRETVEVREHGATSADYRRHLSGVVVARCLATVARHLTDTASTDTDTASTDGREEPGG